MKKPYIILQDTIANRLADKVAHHRRLGYVCVGGLVRHRPFFMQAMEWDYKSHTNRDLEYR